MARPLRLEFAGALYHIISRGDRPKNIDTDHLSARSRVFLKPDKAFGFGK